MAETIGTAYINVEVNADQMQAGLSTARRSVSDLSTQAQAEFNKLSASQKRAATSALNYASNIGKTRAEVRAFNAEQRIGGALGREIAASIRAQDAAYRSMATSASAAATGLGNSAMSAKQLQFATRQLPMQFTDIAVGLAAGQAPLMVLLQQGGQLKDTFGGAGAAMRAMGSYVAGLINPFTVLAAAAGALALAWQQSEDRMSSLNKALILTGNNAGMTAGQLAELAQEMDALEGVTSGSATAALAAVAETGRFTGEQLELVARAAEQMRVATGTAVDETVAKFVEIGKDPVDALLKLHETESFLTEAQIRRIRELEREGDEQAAVTEAMRIYADVVDERSRQVLDSLGGIRSMWQDIKTSALEAGDAVITFAGQADTALGMVQTRMAGLRGEQSEFLQGMTEQLSALASNFGPLGFVMDRLVRGGGPFSGVSGSTSTTAEAEALYDPADFSGVRSRSSTTNRSRDAERARREQERESEAARREALRAAKEAMAVRREEEEQLRRLIAAEDEANEKFLELSATLSGPLAAAEYQHQRNLEEIDRLGQAAGRTSAEIAELKRLEGEAYEEVVDKIRRQSDEMSKFAEQAARNMQDSFADFLFDPFEDGLDGMLESFSKTLQRMMAEAAAAKIFDAIGSYGQQNTGTWWGDLLSSFAGSATRNAKGGVYSGDISRYSGEVHTTPQFFAFAKGAGVFGEAGPEAIMPLSRGPDGKLGVQATGAGATNVKIEMINHGGSVETQRQETQQMPDGSVLIRMINKVVGESIATGTGEPYAAMKGRFGLRDAL